MRSPVLVIILLILSFYYPSSAQLLDKEDESKLYAETKLVNQFFRRFNGEEDEKGERYYPRDKQYRSEKLRKKYIGILFDDSNGGINSDLKVQFAKDVLDKTKPIILDFHGGNWFSEVHTTFTMNGKNEPVTLFMELEKDHEGTKWVISPLSHELDFMNLRKAFNYTDSISQFAVKRFVPDHLSLFLYEIKKGNLKFKTVEELKFHFFQVNGWYFELSEFNRPGYNSGWLISNLVKVNNESEKNLLRKFLYYEGK
jgi:hypothetical protein